MLKCLPIALLCSNRRKWRHGRRLTTPRNAPMRFSHSKSVMKTAFRRKFTTTKFKMRAREMCPSRTTCLTSKDRMKRGKFKKQSSCRRRRRQSRPRLSAVRTTKRKDTWILRLNKKTEWRTRSSTSKNVWRRWRLKTNANAKSWVLRRCMRIKLGWKNVFANKKKKRLCKWRKLRWN